MPNLTFHNLSSNSSDWYGIHLAIGTFKLKRLTCGDHGGEDDFASYFFVVWIPVVITRTVFDERADVLLNEAVINLNHLIHLLKCFGDDLITDWLNRRVDVVTTCYVAASSSIVTVLEDDTNVDVLINMRV